MHVSKKAEERNVSVRIDSTVIGLMKFKCEGLQIEPSQEIALFNSQTHQWEWHTDSLNGEFFHPTAEEYTLKMSQENLASKYHDFAFFTTTTSQKPKNAA